MKYKAIALDLDGTLTDSNKNLSEVNIKAVEDAMEAGIDIILASGRPTFGITPIADKLGLKHKGGYILAYNGGNIIDYSTGELIYSKIFPQECIKTLCKLARDNAVHALSYDGDYVVAEDDTDEYVIKEAICNGAQVKKVKDLEAHITYPVCKFLVVGEHSKLLPVQKKLLEEYEEVIDAFFSEDYFLEVVPKNIAKDAALDALLKIINVKREELIACGDGMNDIPMLKYAGLGVAMANAYPEVKQYAQWIAPSNDDNGVAETIAKYILN